MILAIAISLLAIGILGWQYRQLEKQRIPNLQAEIDKQRAEIGQKSAEIVLAKFMSARIKGDRAQTSRYLTENVVSQVEAGEFNLTNRVENYEVLNSQNLGEDRFRFAAKVYYREGGVGDLVELITLVKILDSYYVDFLEFAG